MSFVVRRHGKQRNAFDAGSLDELRQHLAQASNKDSLVCNCSPDRNHVPISVRELVRDPEKLRRLAEIHDIPVNVVAAPDVESDGKIVQPDVPQATASPPPHAATHLPAQSASVRTAGPVPDRHAAPPRSPIDADALVAQVRSDIIARLEEELRPIREQLKEQPSTDALVQELVERLPTLLLPTLRAPYAKALADLDEVVELDRERMRRFRPGLVEALEQKIEFFQKEVADYRGKYEEAARANRELTGSDREDRLADVERRERLLEDRVRVLREREGKIEQLEGVAERAARLQSESEQLRGVLKNYEANAGAASELEQVKRDLEAARARARSLEDDSDHLRPLSDTNARLERDVRKLKGELRTNLIRLDETTRAKNEAQARLTNVDKLEQQHSDRVAELEDVIRQRNTQLVEAAEKQDLLLEQTIRAKEADLDTRIANRLAALDDDYAKRRDHELAQLKSEVERLKRWNADLNLAIDDARAQAATAIREKDEFAAGMRTAEATLRDLKRDIKSLHDERVGALDAVNGLRSTLITLNGEVDVARTARADEWKSLEALRADAERLKRIHEGLLTEDAGGDAEQVVPEGYEPHPCEALREPLQIETDTACRDEDEWLRRIRTSIEKDGIRYPVRLIESFHTCLKTSLASPLTVLAGVSGTGKSLLPRLYARYGGLHFFSVAVQPGWDSREDLLGFPNLRGNFEPTPLLRAMHQSQRPSDRGSGFADRMLLVLLDEMNLARIEQYFSDFLVRLEDRRGALDDAFIELDVRVQGRRHLLKLPLRENMLFVGTINEDETTHAIADKVLDRGNVLAFPPPAKLALARTQLGPKHEHGLPFDWWASWAVGDPRNAIGDDVVGGLSDAFGRVNKALHHAQRAIGHRVLQATVAYVANHPAVKRQKERNSDAWKKAVRQAIEDQFAQRIMPKLRGIELESQAGRACLSAIQDVIEEHAPGLKGDYAADSEVDIREFPVGLVDVLGDIGTPPAMTKRDDAAREGDAFWSTAEFDSRSGAPAHQRVSEWIDRWHRHTRHGTPAIPHGPLLWASNYVARELASIVERPRTRIVRRHEQCRPHKVKALDADCIRRITRNPGSTLAAKLGFRTRIPALVRRPSPHLHENAVAVRLIHELATHAVQTIELAHAEREGPVDAERREALQRVVRLRDRMRSSSTIAAVTAARVPRANNALLSDARYAKVWHAWTKLVEFGLSGARDVARPSRAEALLWCLAGRLRAEHHAHLMDDALCHFDWSRIGVARSAGTLRFVVPDARGPRLVLALRHGSGGLVVRGRPVVRDGREVGIGSEPGWRLRVGGTDLWQHESRGPTALWALATSILRSAGLRSACATADSACASDVPSTPHASRRAHGGVVSISVGHAAVGVRRGGTATTSVVPGVASRFEYPDPGGFGTVRTWGVGADVLRGRAADAYRTCLGRMGPGGPDVEAVRQIVGHALDTSGVETAGADVVLVVPDGAEERELHRLRTALPLGAVRVWTIWRSVAHALALRSVFASCAPRGDVRVGDRVVSVDTLDGRLVVTALRAELDRAESDDPLVWMRDRPVVVDVGAELDAAWASAAGLPRDSDPRAGRRLWDDGWMELLLESVRRRVAIRLDERRHSRPRWLLLGREDFGSPDAGCAQVLLERAEQSITKALSGVTGTRRFHFVVGPRLAALPGFGAALRTRVARNWTVVAWVQVEARAASDCDGALEFQRRSAARLPTWRDRLPRLFLRLGQTEKLLVNTSDVAPGENIATEVEGVFELPRLHKVKFRLVQRWEDGTAEERPLFLPHPAPDATQPVRVRLRAAFRYARDAFRIQVVPAESDAFEAAELEWELDNEAPEEDYRFDEPPGFPSGGARDLREAANELDQQVGDLENDCAEFGRRLRNAGRILGGSCIDSVVELLGCGGCPRHRKGETGRIFRTLEVLRDRVQDWWESPEASLAPFRPHLKRLAEVLRTLVDPSDRTLPKRWRQADEIWLAKARERVEGAAIELCAALRWDCPDWAVREINRSLCDDKLDQGRARIAGRAVGRADTEAKRELLGSIVRRLHPRRHRGKGPPWANAGASASDVRMVAEALWGHEATLDVLSPQDVGGLLRFFAGFLPRNRSSWTTQPAAVLLQSEICIALVALMRLRGHPAESLEHRIVRAGRKRLDRSAARMAEVARSVNAAKRGRGRTRRLKIDLRDAWSQPDGIPDVFVALTCAVLRGDVQADVRGVEEAPDA